MRIPDPTEAVWGVSTRDALTLAHADMHTVVRTGAVVASVGAAAAGCAAPLGTEGANAEGRTAQSPAAPERDPDIPDRDPDEAKWNARNLRGARCVVSIVTLGPDNDIVTIDVVTTGMPTKPWIDYTFNTTAGRFSGAITGSDPFPEDGKPQLVGAEPVDPASMGRAGKLVPMRQAHVGVRYHSGNGTATLPCPDTVIAAPYEDR